MPNNKFLWCNTLLNKYPNTYEQISQFICLKREQMNMLMNANAEKEQTILKYNQNQEICAKKVDD